MSREHRKTRRTPLVSRRCNRLLAVRLLISTLKSRKLLQYEILDRDEKVAEALGARCHAAMRREVEKKQEEGGLESQEASRRSDVLPDLRTCAIRHLRAVEKSLAGSPERDCLAANTRRLGGLLGLNATEIRALDFIVRLETDPALGEAASELAEVSAFRFASETARVTGCRRDRVQAAFRSQSRLAQSGILNLGDPGPRTTRRSAQKSGVDNVRLLPGLAESLLCERFEFDRVFAPFFSGHRPSKLALSQFDYLGDAVELLCALFAGALRHRSEGVQVLLYGPPGTGKTELAHALAGAVGATLYTIAIGNPSGHSYDRDERLRSFQLAQQVLKTRRKALLLFDEVEDVFPPSFHYLFSYERQKGWTNRLLEDSPVPSIWIANSTRCIDDAYLRRFSLVVEVNRPPKSVRRRISAEHLREFAVDERVLSRIAEAEEITPADLDRTRRMLGLAGDLATDAETAPQAVATLLGSGPRGPMPSALLPHATFRLPAFDPALINTTLHLDEVLHGLRRGGEGRLCLYGPPGTGKTAFAAYLAERLDRDLMTISASDWLDPFVGMTERKMRDSFERAARTNAVLFVDEADSFLQDRSSAKQSWEVTQVNELLKRLEESRGIVLFATNAFDVLDPAVLRRLDVKAAFRPLNQEQTRLMFERTLAANGRRESDRELPGEVLDKLRSLDGVVNGDFTAACRHLHVTAQPMTPANLADALAREVQAREQQKGQSIGFAASFD